DQGAIYVRQHRGDPLRLVRLSRRKSSVSHVLAPPTASVLSRSTPSRGSQVDPPDAHGHTPQTARSVPHSLRSALARARSGAARDESPPLPSGSGSLR